MLGKDKELMSDSDGLPGVLDGTGDGVLPESVLEVHLTEGSNATSNRIRITRGRR